MRAVPVLLLLALAALAGGCRSSRADRPRRDYLSLNRSSWAFLKDTARQSRRLRRENLKQTVAFGRRAPFNRQQRREGRRFAWNSIFATTWADARSMWRGLTYHLRFDRDEFRRSVRFGHLDSGE